MAIKLVMVGAKGRMGQAILALARQDKGFEVVGEVDHGDDMAKVMARQRWLSILVIGRPRNRF